MPANPSPERNLGPDEGVQARATFIHALQCVSALSCQIQCSYLGQASLDIKQSLVENVSSSMCYTSGTFGILPSDAPGLLKFVDELRDRYTLYDHLCSCNVFTLLSQSLILSPYIRYIVKNELQDRV
jgi:hypothetical protein